MRSSDLRHGDRRDSEISGPDPSDLRNVSALVAVHLERLQMHDLIAVMLMGVRSEKRQRWRRGGRGAIEW